MTHVTCRLTAKNRDQSSGILRSVIEYGLPFRVRVGLWVRVENYRLVFGVSIRLLQRLVSGLGFSITVIGVR